MPAASIGVASIASSHSPVACSWLLPRGSCADGLFVRWWWPGPSVGSGLAMRQPAACRLLADCQLSPVESARQVVCALAVDLTCSVTAE